MYEFAIGFPYGNLEAPLQYLFEITGSHRFLAENHITHDVAEHVVLVLGAKCQVLRQEHFDVLSLLPLGLLSDPDQLLVYL